MPSSRASQACLVLLVTEKTFLRNLNWPVMAQPSAPVCALLAIGRLPWLKMIEEDVRVTSLVSLASANENFVLELEEGLAA